MRIVGDTPHCGVISKAIKTPKEAARKEGNFRCPICCSRFTRREGVNYHFSSCARRHGNPNGYRWSSHPSCKNIDTRGDDDVTGPASSAPSNQQAEEGINEEGREEEHEAVIRYDPRTIASDILRVLGEHPYLPPLNAHMEGRGLDSMRSARSHIRLHLQGPRPPTDAPRAIYPTRQGGGDVEMVGAGQKTTAAKKKAHEEKEKAERKARIKAENEVESIVMRPSRSRQIRLSQNPRGILNWALRASEPALPSGWEFGRINHRMGNIVGVFMNRDTGIVTLADPRYTTNLRQLTRLGELPSGWEMRLANLPGGEEQVFFIDRNNQRTTWDDPRGPPS